MPPVEDRNDRERLKAIEMAVGQIEKQFGKGSIMRLGAKDAVTVIPSISTGSVSLDYALGIGGVPRGRVIEIFGPESSGKTTLTLQIIAEAQKAGGMAAFVDAEHALDAQYAKKLGVDLENLLVSQPDNGEQALEIVEVLVRSGGGRRRRRRLGRRARATRRNRRGNGRSADGSPGAPHVAGAPQAHRRRVRSRRRA